MYTSAFHPEFSELWPFFEVLGIRSRNLNMADKCWTTECPSSSISFLLSPLISSFLPLLPSLSSFLFPTPFLFPGSQPSCFCVLGWQGWAQATSSGVCRIGHRTQGFALPGKLSNNWATSPDSYVINITSLYLSFICLLITCCNENSKSCPIVI